VPRTGVGSGEIARNIAHVASATKGTTAGAVGTQQAAGELSRMSSELQTLIGAYQF
jgi:methyl-accepting chemotaxis protein